MSFALRLSVSLGLILILLYLMRDRYDQIFAVLKGTRIGVFALGLTAYLGAIAIASFRLMLIVKAQESIPVTFPEAWSLSFIGYFFNNFLPTAIGGDVVKAYYLSKKSPGKMGSYSSVFVDRVIGLVTMIFMAFVALLFVGNQIIDKNVRYMIYAITALAIMVLIFMTNKEFARKFAFLLTIVKPIEEKLKDAYNSVHGYRKHTALMAQSFVISIVSQLLFFASIGILALSVGSRIPAMDIFLRMPIISMMSLLPSINGLGLREGSTVLLFGPLIGKTSAVAVSVLWLFFLFITSAIGGLIYAVSPQFRIKFKETEEIR